MSHEALKLLLLSLVLILAARPSQQQLRASNEEESDECVLQSSVVLNELRNCAKTKIPADSTRSNSELTNKVDKMAEMLESLQVQLKQNAETSKMMKDCLANIHQRITAKNIINVSGVTLHYKKTRALFWRQARDYCEKSGMKVASLKTKAEINAATNELKKQGLDNEHFWLSATDIGRKAGDFKWADGAPVDDSAWYIGYPKNFKAGQDSCVYLALGESTIYDVACEAAGVLGPYALCEVPPTTCF